MVLPNEDQEVFQEIVNAFIAITKKTLKNTNPMILGDVCPGSTTGEYDRLRTTLEKRYSIQIPMLDFDVQRDMVYIGDLVQYILVCRTPTTTQEQSEDSTDEGEHDGGDVNYYVVEITDPKRFDAYMAEAEDIIEALDMSFSEGTAFKSIWRKAAMRTLGKVKRGSDALYNAQKVAYYGARMVAIEERKVNEE